MSFRHLLILAGTMSHTTFPAKATLGKNQLRQMCLIPIHAKL